MHGAQRTNSLVCPQVVKQAQLAISRVDRLRAVYRTGASPRLQLHLADAVYSHNVDGAKGDPAVLATAAAIEFLSRSAVDCEDSGWRWRREPSFVFSTVGSVGSIHEPQNWHRLTPTVGLRALLGPAGPASRALLILRRSHGRSLEENWALRLLVDTDYPPTGITGAVRPVERSRLPKLDGNPGAISENTCVAHGRSRPRGRAAPQKDDDLGVSCDAESGASLR